MSSSSIARAVLFISQPLLFLIPYPLVVAVARPLCISRSLHSSLSRFFESEAALQLVESKHR